jgi:DNA repair protein RadA/Sms
MAVPVYVCRGCDNLGKPARLHRWKGPCPFCGGWWGIVIKRASDREHPGGEHVEIEDGERVALRDVVDDDDEVPRIIIGGKLGVIDEMLGGGIVADSVTLLSGPPGIGKTTWTLQLLQQLARKRRVLYVSLEESIRQLSRRSKRLGKFGPKLQVIRQRDLEELLEEVDESGAEVVVIDSVNKILATSPTTGDELEPGSAKAIKIAIDAIRDHAQSEEVAFIVIGHVSKDGSISGPRAFEHEVDSILYFDGNKHQARRWLSCKDKNRHFVAEPFMYVEFEMKQKGLVVARKGFTIKKDGSPAANDTETETTDENEDENEPATAAAD